MFACFAYLVLVWHCYLGTIFFTISKKNPFFVFVVHFSDEKNMFGKVLKSLKSTVTLQLAFCIISLFKIPNAAYIPENEDQNPP